MGRVNVFLKDNLLEEINRVAEEEETNRSSLIQAALEKYLEAKRREREEREEQKRMKEACERMDRLAAKLGRWDAQGIIRKFRDSNLKGSE